MRELVSIYWRLIPDWDHTGWREQAACRQSDPDLFFPAGHTGPALGQVEAAKSVCRSCPVQHPCLRFAIETNQDTGIWGGLDEEERRRLRSRRPQGRQSSTIAPIA